MSSFAASSAFGTGDYICQTLIEKGKNKKDKSTPVYVPI